MAKLTQSAIQRARYDGDGKSRDVRWDSALPGLGVRIYPSGRKAFVLSYRAGRTKRLMVVGDYGPMTLDQARRRARKLLVEIADGGDPLTRKADEAEVRTFGELAQAYLDTHARPKKRSWRDDERRLRQHVPRSWMNRRADAIRRSEIASLHARLGAEKPYEANRLLSLLHLMFRLGIQWGHLPENAPNPASGITKFRETKRKRWITQAELPRLAEAIDAEMSVYVRAALWLYLLTGLRKMELLRAKWADVDWDRGVLRLPWTKSGEEQFAPLSGPALAIVKSLPRLEGNEYIFPGRRSGRHLVNIDKNWRHVRGVAGIEDVTLHDLRRTTGSWMSQAGIDLNTIKSALRHQQISTTLIYTRLGEDPAREAMEEHGRRIMEIAGNRLVAQS